MCVKQVCLASLTQVSCTLHKFHAHYMVNLADAYLQDLDQCGFCVRVELPQCCKISIFLPVVQVVLVHQVYPQGLFCLSNHPHLVSLFKQIFHTITFYNSMSKSFGQICILSINFCDFQRLNIIKKVTWPFRNLNTYFKSI